MQFNHCRRIRESHYWSNTPFRSTEETHAWAAAQNPCAQVPENRTPTVSDSQD